MARAPERQRIIQEFRDTDFPPFKGWYGETEGAIRRHFASTDPMDTSLSDLEAVLEKRPASSDFDEARILKQLEALEAARHIDLVPIRTAGAITALQDAAAPLTVHGVKVSVRPTNLVTAYRPGYRDPSVGVVKPYISISEPLGDEGAALMGALVHWYTELQLGHIGQADRGLCFVVDVFARTVHQAPKSYKQRRELIAYSCQEIADRWEIVPTRIKIASTRT